jgi:RNA polymerase sigma-70 factor (ECF subfamily)
MEDLEVIHTYLDTHASPCFSLLYERYARKIYHKCISLLKDEAAAEDATQEIFMKILRNLSRFGERSKFSTWVYSITYNYCIDKLRKEQRRPEASEEPLQIRDEADGDEIPDAEIIEMELQLLKEVLLQLKPEERMLLLMKYQDELSIKEIAASMEVSESAIKMRLKRAKEKARAYRDQIASQTFAEA